ncbi:Cna B-type domain-containing protein [Pseudogracilibacillus sp. ICA-222130]|uniref:Cna B-type domain-containing protein n=1 Tax=Pseudogracilibacillus sp. ICA-222130 TaxID=3134655 RepID=UPI0030C3A50C
MGKRFNLLVLAILLVFQTILTPITSVHTIFAEPNNEEQTNEQSASNEVETLPDLTELERILEDFKELDAEEFTEASYKALEDEVKEAEKLLEVEGSTQEEVDKAVKEMEEALKGLEKVKEVDQSEKDASTEKDATSEKDDATSENDDATSEDDKESEEKAKKPEKDASQKKKATSTKQSVRPAAEMDSEYFNFKISEVKDLQGNPYSEDNPLKPDDEFFVKVDWELLNGHSYQNGDTITFTLPEELALRDGDNGELKDSLGNLVATYEITQTGEVTLTFTEFVETNSQVTGWLQIRAELDQNVVQEEDGNIVIGSIEDEGEQVIPIDRSPINKTVEKQGKPNKSYNADEIEWTVTINKNANSLKDVTLEDVLPEGTEYVEGSLTAVKQAATLNGTPVGEKTEVSVTPSVTDGKLSIPLGDIDEVYTLTYTTKVTDMEVTNFQNNVTFKDADLDDTSANATVTINRGEPLKKGVLKDYDPKTGIIEWELEFNYDQKSLEGVTLADNWKPEGKIELVDGSLTFQEVEIDENGNGQPVGEPMDPSDIGSFSKVDDGFEVSGITTDKPYRVVYQTKVIDRELEGFRMENLASFDGNEDGKGYDIGQHVGKKEAVNIDYAKKEMEWKIRVNMDHRQMNDVIITDTLGDGLTLIEDSISITIGGEPMTDFTLESGNPFKLSNIGDTDKEIIVTYKTTYDPNKLPEDYHANNTADISWIPEGSSDRISREVDAKQPVNKETVDSSWKNANYNPDTKEITWEIIANYRENAYDDFHIVDTPQGNQQLIEESIKVQELKVNANGTTEVVGDANANVTTDGNEIHIEIGKTNKAYKVTYKTSVAGLDDLAKEYTNKAQVKDGDEELSDLEAKASVYGDRKYGNKRGSQDGRRVNWSIDVNLAQEKIVNLKLVDTISDNQAYIEESIKVYHAKLNTNGTVSKTELADPSTYELTVDETEFTIDWNETIERPYIVEYSTLFFAKEGENVRNDYKISGDNISEEEEDASDGYSLAIRQTSGGGAEGTAGYLLVHKIDTTYGQVEKPIEGIQFELIDTSNDSVLKTVTTDAEGYADFGRLLFGEYILREVNTPDGYVGFDEQTITIDEEFVVGESEPLDYKLEIENYKVNGGIEIVKRDEEGNRLEGVEFTLFTADGIAVDTQTTNEAGEISFEEQEPGQYYVQETKSLHGFVPDDTKYEVELTDTQRDAIQLEIENERKWTSVTLEKEWQDEANTEMRPDEISVNLFRNGDYVDTYTIKEVDGWTLTVDGLHAEDDNGEPYEYTITEQEVPGYTPSYDDSGLKVTNTRAEERDFTITKTWYDDDNKDGDRPEEVTVELFRSVEGGDEELVDTYTLTATDDWTLTTDTLPMFDNAGKPYNYVVKEQPVEGYESKVDGFDITNTRVGKTEVQGEKFWKDDQDVERRPESITVHLVQNGERIDSQEVTPNDEGKWLYRFADLEKYDEQGVEYNYSIVEDSVFGYQETYWSTTPGIINIDNIRVGSTELSGTKTWIDGDNAEETRPASITIELLRNGEVVAEQEVTERSDWTYVFDRLPAYDENGIAYEYTVQEVPVDNYESTTNGNDITNTLVGETEVAVTKAWKGEAAERVDVQLLANGEVEETATLTAAKDWTHVFANLPKYDDKGVAIDYTVEEVAMENYQSEVTGDAEKGFTITNTRTGKTEVSVEKVWQGSEEESATITLLANGKEVDAVELTAENNWAHTFTNLEAFDKDGQPIDYTVDEVAMDGYNAAITGDAEEGFTVTNTRTGKTEVTVTKSWKDDGEEKSNRPDSITVNLLANGVVVSEHEVTAENDWSLTITDLEKYDNVGEEIDYTITEHDVAGYESVVDGFDITNTRVDEKSITIHKAWDEKNDKYRPESIEVELFRSVEGGDKESVDTYEVTAENDWSLTIDQLPAFDADGKAYKYEIEEDSVTEYHSEVSGFNITNTQKTYAIGDYTWIDRNKDGIQDDNEEPLEGVTVELFDEDGEKIGETKTDENGRYIFDELPAGKYKVKFTLTEDQAKKYKFTKQNSGDNTINDSDANENGWTTDITLNEKNEQLTKAYEDQTVKASEGIDPTWDAGVIELVDIVGTKTWKDNDSEDRPNSIIVTLFANNEEVDTVEVKGPKWNFSFEGVDKYDENGEEITYTIDEVAVEGYEASIEGFDITNVRTAETSVDINKVWKEDDESVRPDTITVDLLQNDEIIETIDITAKDDWKYNFTELDTFDSEGVAYKYTVQEHDIEGYKSSITETKNGFEITNTFIPEETPEDSDKEDPTKPEDKENKEDPTKPEDKEDKEDPTKPKDEEGDKDEDEGPLNSTTKDEDDDEKGSPAFGGNLPNTASTIFTIGFIGALLLLSGVAMYLGRKRKNA